MLREQLRLLRRRARRAFPLAAALLMAPPAPAAEQDIRGLEVCTSEKQMDRRTACLQANVEFLQQALSLTESEGLGCF
jgi:hypothetical protein